MSEKPIAYEIYQRVADAYAQRVDTKPHNAYYDQPAMLGMLPEINNWSVLDAGCGPGVYSEALIARGANVVACDVSERMLELAQERLGDKAELKLVDLTKPLTMFDNEVFDLINAPLCLDYIADWLALFQEFRRVLKPGGLFQFSCGHPSFDAEYFKTERYFGVEQVESTWKGFGEPFVMKSFRRSIQEFFTPVIEAGFVIKNVVEPLPTEEFKKADPRRFAMLSRRPNFLCLQAKKLGQSHLDR